MPSELALIYVRCWWTRAELASRRKVVDFGTTLSEQESCCWGGSC